MVPWDSELTKCHPSNSNAHIITQINAVSWEELHTWRYMFNTPPLYHGKCRFCSISIGINLTMVPQGSQIAQAPVPKNKFKF